MNLILYNVKTLFDIIIICARITIHKLKEMKRKTEILRLKIKILMRKFKILVRKFKFIILICQKNDKNFDNFSKFLSFFGKLV